MPNNIAQYAQVLSLAISLFGEGADLVKKIRDTYRSEGITDQEISDEHMANQRDYPDPLRGSTFQPQQPEKPPVLVNHYDETFLTDPRLLDWRALGFKETDNVLRLTDGSFRLWPNGIGGAAQTYPGNENLGFVSAKPAPENIEGAPV